MAYGIQEQVDAYEDRGRQPGGLQQLLQMQQQNPKLLAGIAVENLLQEVQASDSAAQAGASGATPSVIDRKLTGLAGMGGLGQQEALATARPGIQQRGQQLQAQNLLQAMQRANKLPMGMQYTPLMRNQMRTPPMVRGGNQGGIVRYQEGGAVNDGLGSFWDKILAADKESMEALEQRQQLRRERGRKLSDYLPFMEKPGHRHLQNILYDARTGLSSLLNKNRPEGTPLMADMGDAPGATGAQPGADIFVPSGYFKPSTPVAPVEPIRRPSPADVIRAGHA